MNFDSWHVQIYTTLPVMTALASALRNCPVPVVVDHFALARPPGNPCLDGYGPRRPCTIPFTHSIPI